MSVDLAFEVELVVDESPFGPIEATVLVTSDGRISSSLWGSLPDVSRSNEKPLGVGATYLMVLGWLHGDVIFGHLMWAGAEIKGDLIDWAACDGLVACARGPHGGAEVIPPLLELSAKRPANEAGPSYTDPAGESAG